MEMKCEPAGTTTNPDAHIITTTGKHNIEVKASRRAMFGQFTLHHVLNWDFAPETKSRFPEAAKAIRDTGILELINQKWGPPSGNYITDRLQGNVKQEIDGVAPILAYYLKDRNTPYVHISGGYGTYHFEEDVGQIGSSRLDSSTLLTGIRARFKPFKTNQAGQRLYGAMIVLSLRTKPQKSILDLEKKEDLHRLKMRLRMESC